MELRTKITPKEIHPKIEIANKTLLVGSCFSENIGKKLAYAGFDVDLNPYGIQFNPLSVLKTLQELQSGKVFTEEDLIFHNGTYHSFSHHSTFSWSNAAQVVSRINDRLALSNIKACDTIIVTWGSSYVYKHIERNQYVANCHKIPQQAFSKEFISQTAIEEGYGRLIESMPNKHFILTVSPVRHWKDGAINNSKSKANLILAAQSLAENLTNVSYFPAYELVVDDLRDYRFYADDMLHPGETAVNYIWDKFRLAAIDASNYQLMEKQFALNKAREHVFMSDNADEKSKHAEFIQRLESEIRALKKA